MASSSSSSPDGALTPSQLLQFQQDGYLVLRSFFDPSAPLARARQLVQAFDPANHPLTRFATGEEGEGEGRHVGDEYFLDSGDRCRWFLEEDAVREGRLVRAPELSVNKVGHALHVLDPTFHALSFSPRVQALVRSLRTHQSPQVLQSMIICKQPEIGGAVRPHNDSTFLYTSPPSALGLWFALEKCTGENGALSFIKGSHRFAPGDEREQAEAARPREDGKEESLGRQRGVNRRFVRQEGGGTTFVNLADDEEAPWEAQRAEMECCEPGDLVIIHGSVMHQSNANLSASSRYIYTFHVIEGQDATYDERNWLQPTPAMPFSELYKPPPVPAEDAVFARP